MQPSIWTLAALALVLFSPVGASAQTRPDWASRIKPRKAVFIITTDGEQIDGKAGVISREGIVVQSPAGQRFIRYDQVFRAERKDSALSGLVYGGTFGFVVGVVNWKTTYCGREFLNGLCRGYASMAPMLLGIGGALVGWGVDALVTGRRTVYEVEPPARLSLVVGRDRAGLALTW